MYFLVKLAGLAFWLLATGVALHFVFSAFYDDLVDVSEVWEIIDWFMAVGTVLALMVHYARKRMTDSQNGYGQISREYLEVNAAVYASVLLTLWFFWNWFDLLTTGRAGQDTVNSIIWTLVDPLFVIVMGVTGCYLWRSAREY